MLCRFYSCNSRFFTFCLTELLVIFMNVNYCLDIWAMHKGTCNTFHSFLKEKSERLNVFSEALLGSAFSISMCKNFDHLEWDYYQPGQCSKTFFLPCHMKNVICVKATECPEDSLWPWLTKLDVTLWRRIKIQAEPERHQMAVEIG